MSTTKSKASTVSLAGDEVRTYASLQLRATAAEDGGLFTRLTGLAVPYDSWTEIGWFSEQFARGAFRKSIREASSRLPLLLWHDNRTFPIGVSRSWTETDEGLVGEWDIDDSENAQEGARLADKGMLTGMSVGFALVNREGANEWIDMDTGEPPKDGDLWRVENLGVIRKEARLLEVSLTPTPAYAGAQVALVRSSAPRSGDNGPRRSAELEHWHRQLEGLRR